MSYVISIPSYESTDGYTLYKIHVKSQKEGTWTFSQRYSLLRDSHEQLRRAIRVALPAFPPKKLFGNTKDSFIKTRRSALEDYFVSLTRIPEVCNSEVFKGIIRPKAAVLEAAPVIVPPVLERAPSKPATRLTRDLESRLGRISTETAEQFINLSELPAPLEAEDLKRKQREYQRMVTGVRVEWTTGSVRSEGDGRAYEGSRELRSWMGEKTRELEGTFGGIQSVIVVAD